MDDPAQQRSREYVRKLTNTLEEIRDVYPQDARKRSEFSPTADDSRPFNLRKSFDQNPGDYGAAGSGRRHTTNAALSINTDRARPNDPVEPIVAHKMTHVDGPRIQERPPGRKRTLEAQLEEKPEENLLNQFPKSEGLSSAQADDLLKKYGRNELPEKVTSKWYIFVSLLWQPMPVMMWIAAAVEFGLKNWIDGGILIAINIANACLSFYETTKAGDAVAALKASLKPTAICMRDGVWNPRFDARLLVPGDLIELAAGAAVPADCMINHGQIDVDESAMTGESLPATIHEREMAKMGGTVARGETHATVVFTGKDTFFGKTASMLGDSGKGYSNLQRLLLKIIIILCALSFILCGSAFIYLEVKIKSLRKAASFAVVVIVASIPMAVEIVTTTTLAIGSKTMSKFGAIVSRLAAIEDLAGLNMLCSDKTGTLTKNKMMIQPDAPTYVEGLTQMDLLKQAAMAAKWEAAPKDALDTLFLRCHLWHPNIKTALAAHVAANPGITQAQQDEFYDHEINAKLQEALRDYHILAFVPFDPRVKRTESTIKQKSTGKIFKVTKGAPHVLHELDKDERKGHIMMDKVTTLGEDGVRAVAIAVSDPINDQWIEGAENQKLNVTWHITGMLTFLDPPRDDTAETIRRSEAYGVPVRMITGDHLLIAKKTCRDLKMGNVGEMGWPNIQGPSGLPLLDEKGQPPEGLVKNYGHHIRNADGFAQVFPEHKFLIVETFRQLGYKCGMTGDGVNDAPALKRADVGIAVAGATDAARAAADIVLTQEGLSTIVLGMEVSRCIFARMKSFLTYRIAATLQLLFFFFIAVFAFQPNNFVVEGKTYAPEEWPHYFSLPVIYLMIITVINDGTLISIGYDHAVPSKFPERWILPALFLVSSTLAAVACLSSLLLLYWCLTSWQTGSLFDKFGLGGLRYGHVVCVMFLKVAVSDILTLFSSRTAHQFFFQRMPHPILAICAVVALCISTTLALVWPCATLDEIHVCGLAHHALSHGGKLIALWVWLYAIVVFIIQDVAKVIVWRLILKFNWFNINNEVVISADIAHDKSAEKQPLLSPV